LILEGTYDIQQGYSGGPVIDQRSMGVMAITSHSLGGRKGVAISIETLERIGSEIWAKTQGTSSRIGHDSSSSRQGVFRTEAPKPEDPASSDPPTPPPSPEPEPIHLAGVGQQATEPFNLDSGLAIFKMTHQGQLIFIVGLLDQDGEDVDPVVANAIGPSQISKAVYIAKAASYVLNVNADGPWTIDIEQPRPSSAPATTSFEGSGSTATSFFQLSRGLHTLRFTHQGQRNFIVGLLDKSGRVVDPIVANAIGPSNSSKAVRVLKDGIYLLNVTADGPWTAEIQ
jgi:hypothetical protein